MRRVIRTLSVVAVLLALTGLANAELVTSGAFDNGAWGMVNTGWTDTRAGQYVYDYNPPGGYVAYYDDATLIANVPTISGYDYTTQFYYSDGGKPAGATQLNFQFLNLTAGMHYVLSADVRAWTVGNAGESTTGQVRLFTLNGDQTGMTPVGGGWSYFTANTIQWTSTAGFAYEWHHETVSFDIPAGFGLGTQQGIALFDVANTTANNGVSFNNVSLVASPIPEPGTVALLATGLFGLMAYAWRKRK
jgi:hypothetical protein